MKGMFLDFAGTATVEAAVHEYMTLHGLDDKWLCLAGSHRKLAELIEAGKGIPRKEILAYLYTQAAEKGFPTWSDVMKPGEVFTEDPLALDSLKTEAAPSFKSPAQRRWFFATQPQKDKAPGKGKGAGDRWKEVMQAARNAVKGQPQMTGEELVLAINGIVDPDLTESEEGRVRELVSPERGKKLVSPPEKTPREERTPEIEELIEQEWSRIQEELRTEKEKKKERTPEKGPQNRPQYSPGKDMIPPLGRPGNPYVGAGKQSYLSKKDFFCKKYCDIADAAHWRAFIQTIVLVRGGAEDSCIKETIESEYPNVDVDMVLKAVKDFIKDGARDPYIGGGTLAMKLLRQGSAAEFVASTYQNLRKGGVDQGYLNGFRACFPPKAQQILDQERS